LKPRPFIKLIIPATVCVILLTALQAFVLVYSPEEQTMGIIQRIFYLHVPLAWCAFLAFLVVFIGSISYLVNGNTFWDNIAHSSAVTGLLFNSLTLITGAIWAKAVWGIWWTWDPRLTTSLVLWFIYAGYILVRNFGIEQERAARFAAVIGISGFADVPVVALSIVLWRTQHPPALIFAGGLTPTMLLILVVCLTIFTLIYALLLAMSLSLHWMENSVAELKMMVGSEDEAGESK
jgi:heme exporter protein C